SDSTPGYSETIAKSASLTTHWLTLGAVAGPVLFTLAWFVLGFLSPGYTLFGTRIPSYSPMSQPISGLGMGITAPFMNAAFVLSGILLLAGVIGVVRIIGAGGQTWVCATLLALSPSGLIICGIYHLDSFLPHLIGFLLACGAPVLSFLVTGLFLRRFSSFRRFGTWLLLGSPLTLVLMVLFFMNFTPTAAGSEVGIAGLIQRILAIEVLAWFAALGWLAFRRSSRLAF
ncbi:MAG: DUF998 domain-containing protein, partial [Ktedonobacteraceae bacterium]